MKSILHGLIIGAITVIGVGNSHSTFGQTLGNWYNNAGTTANDQARTPGSLGVGFGFTGMTGTQEAWGHFRWCPPFLGPDQAGLLLTLKKCTTNTWIYNPNQFNALPVTLGDVAASDSTEQAGSTVQKFAFTSFLPLGTYYTATNPTTSYISGVNNGREPLFWARTEEPAGGTFTAGYETQFIVMPHGHTGINISAPRAALDVRGGGANKPTAIFGMQALRSNLTPSTNAVTNVNYKLSRHVAFYPLLWNQTLNPFASTGNLGMIFTDGLGTNGENSAASLLIAPWSASSTAGGIKIDAVGNVSINKALHIGGYIDDDLEVRGELTCNGFKSMPQWWPDYVFDKGYNLITLDSLSSFIALHKHLPGIPSRESILQNGQNIGVIQQHQQETIEQLALYIIEQKRINDEQKTRIEEMAQQLRKIQLTVESITH